jgi:hypothetical protein
MRLLREVLDRLAAQGRLRLDPEVAARVVMSANTGVALALVLRSELYPDATLSPMVRDIVHGALVLDAAPASDAGESDRIAAITLRSTLPVTSGGLFTERETGLLDEWLERIQSRPRPS